MSVPISDRDVLRHLAGDLAEIASLPVHTATIRQWNALNGLKLLRPMVMIDQIPWHEMDVDGELTLQCSGPFCRGLETQLRQKLYSWRHMRADMVVEPVVDVGKAIHNSGFGIPVVEDREVGDAQNSVVSHFYIDQFTTDADIERIQFPCVRFDAEATSRAETVAHEIFDGVLPVRMQGVFPSFAPWDLIVQWRGHEALLYELVDHPDFMHRIVQRVTDAQLAVLDQLEEQGLLGQGQGVIHCTGAYTDELPAPGFEPNRVRARDLWTSGMSQIFAAVSPAMHEEFELPYLGPWFARFGLAYYGCCEPLDLKVAMIRRLPNVRKVSMSPWVDQDRGAAALGGDFVFSRKPNPAFLATDVWHPETVEHDLRETVRVCARHGCPLELILKDISTVRYDPRRLWEWSDIARRVVTEEAWS